MTHVAPVTLRVLHYYGVSRYSEYCSNLPLFLQQLTQKDAGDCEAIADAEARDAGDL